MLKEALLEEIIEGYRNVIFERYQYVNLKEKHELPDFLSEEVVNLVRNYFLNFIYPPQNKRFELNDAFKSLDSFIKQPEKLFNILVDSVKLAFKYGRHLPKILNTGIKALKSFRAASSFENKLVEQAIAQKINAPYDKTKIYTLIKSLSRSEIEEFIEQSQSLIVVFHDKPLVVKVRSIIQDLINIMTTKSDIYSTSEIKGLEIGLEMLTEGEILFNSFPKNDQEQLIQLIIVLERGILDEIF